MLLLLAMACGDEDEEVDLQEQEETPAPVEVVEAPVTAPQPAEGQLTMDPAGRSISATAFALLEQFEGDVLFSPASINVALTMLHAGASGDTASGIETALSLPAEPQQALGAWQTQVLGEGAWTLRMANRAWTGTDSPIKPAYLGLLDASFGATTGSVDFADPSAVDTINAWVAENTEDKIPDLLKPGSLTGDTRLVLTNAVYFLGTWVTPFKEDATQDGPFQTPSGEAQVPMMRQLDWFAYYEADGVQLVELPYEGDRLSAYVVLADAISLEDFSSWAGSAQRSRVQLTMPRFEMRWTQTLNRALSGMGMGQAFTGAADFSAMSDEGLFVSQVVHEAWMRVDESGTEAAAATGMMVRTTSVPPPPMVMTVDRPFHFFVVDKPTGGIVFAARVENPSD